MLDVFELRSMPIVSNIPRRKRERLLASVIWEREAKPVSLLANIEEKKSYSNSVVRAVAL